MKKKKDKILIIDDDPMNVLILEEILAEKYELKSASCGEAAPSLVEEFHPDLILLDIMLPKSDGYEICHKLKQDKRIGFTKIILVSAKTLLKDRLAGYNSGADDFLSKPFDPDELLAKVKVFIRLKSVEEVERVKDDLLNIFSHETRTPLNAIIGFAKLLKDNPALEEMDLESIDMIVNSGVQLLDLSNKAIQLSNLRKQHNEIEKIEVELSSLVSTATEVLEEKAEKKGITIENKAAEMITHADFNLIETALMYILENAVKFSPNDALVSIYSEQSEDGNWYTLKVANSGKGIDEDRLDSLFDEFGVEDVSHHGRGHGLSLAIVKYTMELHGGSVSARNLPEAGAEFSLSFPIE